MIRTIESCALSLPPLASCLLGLKVATGPQLTRNFRPPATPSRSLKGHVSGYRRCVDSVARPSLVISKQAELLFPPPPAQNIGRFTTYIAIVARSVLMYSFAE